jgi:hypothetical protein
MSAAWVILACPNQNHLCVFLQKLIETSLPQRTVQVCVYRPEDRALFPQLAISVGLSRRELLPSPRRLWPGCSDLG